MIYLKTGFLLFVTFIVIAGADLRAQTLLDKGIELYDDHQYGASKIVLEQVVREHPDEAQAYYYLGLIALNYEHDSDKTIDLLDKAVKLDGKNPDYHYALGMAYGDKIQNSGIVTGLFSAGKIARQFKKAIELKPDHVQARKGLIQYYLQAPGILGGSYESAMDQAEQIMNYDAFEGYLSYANIYENLDNVDKTEQYYLRAINAYPDSARSYHRLGYFMLNQDRTGEAITLFKKMVELSPDDANAYDSLGDGYLHAGELDSALTSFSKAYSTDSTFYYSIYKLAYCYEKTGQNDKAVAMYRKYLTFQNEGSQAKNARKKINELGKK